MPAYWIGVTLHVEKCGDRPAHEITFHRSRSSYVNIGRKSASGEKAMRKENDDQNAVFACQVVSAKHAKLVFSDNEVSIIDLHSRHGTHLLRGEGAPRTLKAEVETPLADGDIITFGKAVRIRVELVKEKPSLIASQVGPSLTPINSLVDLISRTRMSDDRDSDIEEVSVPSPSRTHSLHIKIPAFKYFIHNICRSNEGSNSSPVKDTFPSLAEFLVTPSPSPEDLRTPSPPIVVVDTVSNSRSHSPMEMSTPSPSATSEAEAHPPEPPVVGAWPSSRSESPHPPAEDDVEKEKDDSDNVAVGTPPPPAEPAETGTVTATTQEREPDSFPEIHACHFMDIPPPTYFPVGPPFGRHLTSPFNACHPAPSGFPGTTTELRASIKIIEDRVSAMQGTISDLRSRQSFTEEDVMDIQTHVDMLEPESDRLFCRLNLAERNIASLSTLQTQNQSPPEFPTNDLKACAEALGSLVTEMKTAIEEKMMVIDAATEVESLKRKRAEDEDAGEPEKKMDTDDTAAAMAVGAVVTWSALAFA
ncbi:hypothetical protein F5J12DRAFT_816670 [Pisolithus orientalis]|uniref:uncharacterized protein n=1 Tax=Pisolithus orientalis TaxID=936130 RepID=UPI002224D24A|nr:uncharacterized protein F5J12DRAFT_816670 [Pisolithus orientalis]KAI6015214.1 hypothetical protein F5J12DRAFT_816670 [Pisolithus orientalis]